MNYKNIAFYFMILVVIVLSLYVYFFIHSEGYKCLNNAPAYAVQEMEKANNANVSCLCIAYKSPTSVTVKLDDKGISSYQTSSSSNWILNTSIK